ncbi:MAG: head GIN domain-containing protein [Sphingomonas sp.]
MRSIALLALIPLAACSGPGDAKTAASGVNGTKTFAVDGFSAVEATGPDDVDVRVGSGFSVRAEGDTGIMARLEIVRNGDTLEIRRKSNSGFNWGGGERNHLKIYVTMPRITAASTTGSGDMAIDHVDGDAFKVDATGSGDLAIASMNVQRADFSLTGSGNVSAGGSAKTGSFSIAGSGDIDAPKLTLNQADVSVMGSGSVSAAVAGPAKVDVMGSGDVTLTGGAKCTTSKMGSGDIRCS